MKILKILKLVKESNRESKKNLYLKTKYCFPESKIILDIPGDN